MIRPGDPKAAPAGADEKSASDTFRSFLQAAVILLLMLLAVAGLKSYRDLSVAQAHEADLRRSIDDTQANIRLLSEQIDRINHDPAMLEQLAREELGWVREHDLVIVLPDEHAVDESAAAEQPRPAAEQP